MIILILIKNNDDNDNNGLNSENVLCVSLDQDTFKTVLTSKIE